MHRFALYSDIHGNAVALDAVLADIEMAGITERYCLGDLVGYGPSPAAVIARVRSTGDITIRGNYDDGVGNRKGGCGCFYGTPQAQADGEASYEFTDRVLDDADHEFLAGLLDQHRFETHGVRVLMCHGSPRRINEYLLLDRPDHHLAKLADEADADLICVGHVHIPYHRGVTRSGGGVAHFVSDGSVGKPKDGDPRAAWAEVAIGSAEEIEAFAPNDAAAECAGGAWVGVNFHRVAYDIDTVVAEMAAAGLPLGIRQALRDA